MQVWWVAEQWDIVEPWLGLKGLVGDRMMETWVEGALVIGMDTVVGTLAEKPDLEVVENRVFHKNSPLLVI